MLDALQKDYELRDKSSPQFLSHLAHIRMHFCFIRATNVSAEMIDAYVAQRLEAGAANASVNRSTQILGQAFKLAIARKHLTTAPSVRRLSEKDNVRQGFFSDVEFRNVLANLPDYLQDFVRFGYLTGWRKGEIESLCWEEVDGDIIRLRPENSKNGEGRMIVLEGELYELVKHRRNNRMVKTPEGTNMSLLVFHHNGHPIVNFRKTWATACPLAGANGRLFHDLRRSAVRNMIRAGVPEKVAMQVSGHKTHAMLSRYNIISEHDLRDAMQRTQEYLKSCSAEKPVATRGKEVVQ
jgi:integrase